VCDAVGLLVRRVVCRNFCNEVTVPGVFGRQGQQERHGLVRGCLRVVR
jgi:hypothetical protein